MRTEGDFLVDVLTRLHQATVDYMLAGSMASNYWGIPRTTHDLYFVVVLAPHQVASFAAAFRSGMFIQEDSVRSALDPPHQFNVLDEQSALRPTFGCSEMTLSNRWLFSVAFRWNYLASPLGSRRPRT